MSLLSFEKISRKRLIVSIFFWLLFVPFFVASLYWTYTRDMEVYNFRYTKYFQESDKWLKLQIKTLEQGLSVLALENIAKAQGQNRNEQLRIVMSTKRPLEIKNGDQDYTLTPGELFELGVGDCDDIAHLWYQQLNALGIPSSVMYIMVEKGDGDRYLHAATLTENAAGEKVVLDTNTLFFIPVAFEQWKENYKVKFLFEGKGADFKISTAL